MCLRVRTNNRVHDHLHGLCLRTVIYIDRLTILMADHSACHQIVALHTNIENWMYTRRETWVYRGNSAGNRVENGRGQINGQSWQNHILFGKKVKRCDFQLNRMNKWVGMDKNRLPTGKPWPVKHRQALRVRPSVRPFVLIARGCVCFCLFLFVF